jgi:hypothetical protein
MIALEVAQQLSGIGERVAFLGMIDTWGPDYPKLLPTVSGFRAEAYELGRRARYHSDQIRGLGLGDKLKYFARGVVKINLRVRRKLMYGYKRLVRKAYRQLERPIPLDYIQIEDQIQKAARKYVPKEFDGNVTFFRAKVQPKGIFTDPLLGWGGMFRGGMEIHDVPGDHLTLMKDPYVRVLAETFTGCILTAFKLNSTRKAGSRPTVSASDGLAGTVRPSGSSSVDR